MASISGPPVEFLEEFHPAALISVPFSGSGFWSKTNSGIPVPGVVRSRKTVSVCSRCCVAGPLGSMFESSFDRFGVWREFVGVLYAPGQKLKSLKSSWGDVKG